MSHCLRKWLCLICVIICKTVTFTPPQARLNCISALMHTVIIMAFLAVPHITWSNMQESTFSSISTASILTLPHDVLLELHIEFLTIHVQPDNEIIWMIYIKRFGSGSLLSYIYPTYVFIMILIGLLVLCTSASLHKKANIFIWSASIHLAFVSGLMEGIRYKRGVSSLVSTHLHPYFLIWKSLVCTVIFMVTHTFHCLAGTPADRV